MGTDFSWDRFEALPIVGILRGFEVDTVRLLVEAAARGGLGSVEVTMNSPSAREAIAAALEAGAAFIVTPVVSADVIVACRERSVPVMAGALTPSEIYGAWTLGADMVKVFPANQFGPGYLKDLKGPLPQIRLMPTGGVDASTLGEFYSAGASAFGVGGALFSTAIVAAASWDKVEEGARSLVEAYRSASGGG